MGVASDTTCARSRASTILILAGNLALVGLVGYIIQKDFRSPYLQVLNRSWRERKRIPIYHTILSTALLGS